MERGEVLSLPVALAANHSSLPPTTFCYGLHLIPDPGSLLIRTWWHLLCLGCILSAFLDTSRPFWGQKVAATASVLGLLPASKGIHGENKKTCIKQLIISPTLLVSCLLYQAPGKKVDLLKASLATTRLVLRHSLLPSTAPGPDGSHAVVVARAAGRVHSPVLSCVTLSHPSQLFSCFKAVIKSCSERCGRDQRNVPVGLQGQSLNMHCPIKYSFSKGVCDLSSKLIEPLGESLHWDILSLGAEKEVLESKSTYYCYLL